MAKKIVNLVKSATPVESSTCGGVNEAYVRSRPAEQVFALGNGMGLDSMGMLVGLRDRGLRPQVITFADVGNYETGKVGEKPQTYDYIPVLAGWLRKNGFPELTVVRRKAVRTTYETLYECCIVNQTLPSLAFGFKGCSNKFKIVIQEAYMKKLEIVQACWKAGYKIIKAIGYDAGPADIRRGSKAEDERYVYWYPLREWGWDRDIIREVVAAEGLAGWNKDNEKGEPLHWVEEGGVPVKSACFFCPASKHWEIDRLAEYNPDLLAMAVGMEENARNGKHGLGRGSEDDPKKGTKGLGRNYAWGDYAKEKGFSLPVLNNTALASCEACDAV